MGFGEVSRSSCSSVTCSSVSHHSAVLTGEWWFDSVTNRRQGRRTGGVGREG